MAAKKQLPLRTPSEARQWLRDHGVTIKAFAEAHHLSVHAVNDALRGVGSGRYGASYRAAVALGLKRVPDSLTNPLEVLKNTALPGSRKSHSAPAIRRPA